MEVKEYIMMMKNRCVFIKLTVILIFLISSVLSTIVSGIDGNEYYVDSSYWGYSDGTAEFPYQSIQEAIDEVEDGDTIYVFGGEYNEIITIDKKITLWGGVEGTESIINPNEDIRYTVTITVDHVEIQDFSFTDQDSIITSPIGALVSIQADNIVITGSNFYSTNGYGIHIANSANGAIINGNTINNTKFGIFVESSDTNDIFNNEIHSCEDTGIYLENIDENRLYDNTIYNCSKAIHGRYSSRLNLSNNTLYENTYTAMLIENCQQAIIQNNYIYNSTTGLYLQSDYCSIKNNEFENNQRGITLVGNNNDIFTNNFALCSGSGIFSQSISKQNKIYNNSFEGNGKNAEDEGNNEWYIDNIGNYWDDYNWIDLNKDGIGDIIYKKLGIEDVYPLGFFVKRPDKRTNPSPDDKESGVGLKIDLSVKIVDEDSDLVDVTYYNAENNKEIGQDKRVESGKYAHYELTIPFNTTYAWYVHVTDGVQENISDTFFFTTMITPPDNEPPSADGNGPYYGNAGEPISFDASNSYDNDGDIDFYRWNFGDGTSELLAKQPIHTYEQNGLYKVTLTVIDDLGATDTITFSVPIGVEANEKPIADLGGPYQGKVGEKITFNGSNSKDEDGTITNYTWSFGDETMGYGMISDHTYSNSGSYLLILTVMDNRI
jgi:parallel beta-helix repeat protein